MMIRSIHWLLVPALFQACSPAFDDEEHEDEPEELEESTEAVITCTPRSGVGYESGDRRTITLVSVDGKPVEINTANAFSNMRDAAARAGVRIRVNSGFRTNEEQQRLYSCMINCNCNSCNTAARPGYSAHQSGLALDLNTRNSGVLTWLNRNASRYGFRRTVSSEPWHWQYSGARATGPCSGTPPAATPPSSTTPPPSSTTPPSASTPTTQALEIVAPRAGGHYANGVWFKAKTNGTVHHVRYDSGGYLFGASEDAGAEFAYRRVFNTLGQHNVTVRGYDREDREITKKTVTIYVDAGEASQPEIQLVDLEDGMAYRNGFSLQISPMEGVASVVYSAGEYGLGVSRDTANGFPVDVVFNEYGARSIIVQALAADGRLVSQKAITIVIVPGTEDGLPPAIRFMSPLPGDQFGRDTIQLMAAGSDSVTRVVYYADGVEIGASSDAEGAFPTSRQFWQVGLRHLRVIGFNQHGDVAADQTIDITIR
ncbi:MAG: D-alanyl-D-alanine carboxypeptidase family protein [Deltaproteobacteria bacterium]|nr:D-alanyl-D-alanine carboxypeptidase family protein [Deltaproteobacteria bacterium]